MPLYKTLLSILFISACSNLNAQVKNNKIVKIPGITEPFQDAEISASVNGKIETIHYREGQFVEKDTVVIQLEDELEQLKVNGLKIMHDDKSELESATAKMETAKINMESTQKLFQNTKAVSKQELDEIILQYKVALADKNGQENKELREEIELQKAEYELEQRAVKAPFPGVVADVKLEEGEACTANENLFRLVDISKFHFTCNLENDLAISLKKDQAVDLEIVSGLELIEKKGIVEFIAPTIDPASGLRKVKILVDNPDFKITPGATGTLNIQVATVR